MNRRALSSKRQLHVDWRFPVGIGGSGELQQEPVEPVAYAARLEILDKVLQKERLGLPMEKGDFSE